MAGKLSASACIGFTLLACDGAPANEPPGPAGDPGARATTSPPLGSALLSAMNDARARGGSCGPRGELSPTSALVPDVKLDRAAEAHALDMLALGYFGHQAPDGARAAERNQRAGFTGTSAEILARGDFAPQTIVAKWLSSPDHCAALLGSGYTRAGVSVALGRQTLWVAELGAL